MLLHGLYLYSLEWVRVIIPDTAPRHLWHCFWKKSRSFLLILNSSLIYISHRETNLDDNPNKLSCDDMNMAQRKTVLIDNPLDVH